MVTAPFADAMLTLDVPFEMPVAPPPVAAMLIAPAVGYVIDMPDPAVNVARVNPVPLPMSIWPLVGVDDKPVPPDATPKAVAKVVVPATERLAPTATPPKLSLTMLVVVPDGWITLMVLRVDMLRFLLS